MNFLHVAIGLFWVCVALLVGVSLVTPAPSESKMRGLTFQTTEKPADSAMLQASQTEFRVNVGLSIILVAIVWATWYYFS